MESGFFVIVGIGEGDNKFWVSNTDPVVWSTLFSEAKRYLDFSDVKSDIKYDISTFKATFAASGMQKLVVYEADKNGNIIEEYFVLHRELILGDNLCI